MYLGIEKDKGIVYESGYNNWGMRAVFPSPHLFNMQIAYTPETALEKLAKTSGDRIGNLIFREDSFDPVSMIRRGRVYEFGEEKECQVCPIGEMELTQARSKNGVISKRLFIAPRCPVKTRHPFEHLYAAIGGERASSVWRIVLIDHMYLDEELLTLRHLHSLGALPDLDMKAVPSDWQNMLQGDVQKVVDSLNRANSSAIVELCRHAAATALFAYFHEDINRFDAEDLGPLCGRAREKKLYAVANCGEIIAKLHVRLKPGPRMEFNLRPVNDRDAELTVYSLACILSDLGYAKPT